MDAAYTRTFTVTAQNYRRTQTKHRKAKKGQRWTKLGRIDMDYIWVNNFEKRRPTFFQIYTSLYLNVI